MFDVDHGITMHAMHENQASSLPQEKSHVLCRVAVGTCGILQSYNGDCPSKPVFIQQLQDSCLDVRDTPGFSSRLGRAIGTPLQVRREMQGHFPLATGIL